MLIGEVTLASVSVFTGAAVYIGVAEQPARLFLDDRSLLTQWKHSYKRAARMQAGLVVVSGALGLLSAWQMDDWHWLVGAAIIIVNGPYTLLGIMPRNNLLNKVAIEQADSSSRALIVTWGKLHTVRTGLGIAAMLADIWALMI